MPDARKRDQLRATIITLADGPHMERIRDLLDALEDEIGAAAIRRCAAIVQVHADSAPLAHSDPDAGRAAQRALTRAAQSVRLTGWAWESPHA